MLYIFLNIADIEETVQKHRHTIIHAHVIIVNPA